MSFHCAVWLAVKPFCVIQAVWYFWCWPLTNPQVLSAVGFEMGCICFAAAYHLMQSVSQGQICSDNSMSCFMWDRNSRENLLTFPVTVYSYQASQSGSDPIMPGVWHGSRPVYQLWSYWYGSTKDDRLIGLVVKAATLKAEDLGFKSRLRCGIFSIFSLYLPSPPSLSLSMSVFLSFSLCLWPPRWPSDYSICLESGRSRVQIPLVTRFFWGRVIPVT